MRLKIMIIILFLIAGYFSQNYIINISPSEPLGLYKIKRKNSYQQGDIVAVCLSHDLEKEGLRRGYLIPGVRCSEAAPLLKTIIGVPGDTVILKNSEIIVNGKTYSYVTKPIDSHGSKLKRVARGIYKATSLYWLIGPHDANSWDSRYWGGILKSHILYCLKYEF